MLLLPELRRQRETFRPAVSEVGAGELAWALLATGPDRHSAFQETLRHEPGLVLWTACQLGDGRSDLTLRGLADCLVAITERDLDWPGTRRSTDDRLRGWWVDVAIAGLLLARDVDRRAAEDASGNSAIVLALLASLPLRENSTATDPPGVPPGVLPSSVVAALQEVDSPQRDESEWAVAAEQVAAAQRRLAARPPGARVCKSIQQRWDDDQDGFTGGRALPAIVALRAKLGDLEANFQTALRREKMAALRQLAYGASHEINNPLANISTRAQTLLRDERDPDRRRKLATIAAQALRAHEMISDLMLFAKPPDLNSSELSIPELIRGLVDEMQPQAEQLGIELRYSPTGESLPAIAGDRLQLEVALSAIIRNAFEAIDLGGLVEISARSLADARGGVEICIQDSGPGLSEEVLRHLFDPYFSGREAGRGLGLGLSKCWTIVTGHGGSIDVSAPASGGASFTIRLPRQPQISAVHE